MEFEIKENKETYVVVKCSIPVRKKARDKRIHVDPVDAESFLSQQGIEVKQCRSDTVLNNYSVNIVLEGEWLFEKRLNIQEHVSNAKKVFNKETTESEKIEEPKKSTPSRSTSKRRRSPKSKRELTTEEKDQLFRA